MHKLIAIVALATFTTPALAGVLPIAGPYCGEDILIKSSGSIGEEDCRFTKLIKTGPTWYIVSQTCAVTGKGTMRVAVSPDGKTISISDPNEVSEPVRLDRCPS